MRAARGRLWVAALAAVFLVPTGAQPSAQAVTASANTAVPIHSSYENSKRSISRDIGISTRLPDGHQLWLFGDTGIWQNTGTWHQTGFIPGSTAMLAKGARGQVPSGGELPTGTPKIFLPTPKNVYLPDGSGDPCVPPDAQFAARWPTGIAVFASNPSQVLITYGMVCVTKPKSNKVTVRAEGWGYLLYNWKRKRIDKLFDVFKPKASGAALATNKIFGDPLFSNGMLTMFSSQCSTYYVGCSSGSVFTVTMRATFSAMDRTASYQPKRAATDGSSVWAPLAISVGRYPSGLRLLETTSITGDYKVFSASEPTGPWHLLSSGTLPGCPSEKRFCFALEGHPDISTASSLIVSYHDPDVGPYGHIVVSAIPD